MPAELHGAVLVVSDRIFLFVIGHDGAPLSPTWHALLFANGSSADATIWSAADDTMRLRIGKSLYTLRGVSDTLLRWRIDPSSTWEFRRDNLPLPRGSCWRMCASHPRYERVYQTYMGAMKRRFTGLPRTVRYLTHAAMQVHALGIAVPTVAMVPRDRVRRQMWTGRVVS